MTDDKNEREHCGRVAREAGYTMGEGARVRELLLRERAAAFAQGLEQGRGELKRALDTEDLSDYGSDFSQWMADLKDARDQRDALQSRFSRLESAVRAELPFILGRVHDALLAALSPPTTSTKEETKP